MKCRNCQHVHEDGMALCLVAGCYCQDHDPAPEPIQAQADQIRRVMAELGTIEERVDHLLDVDPAFANMPAKLFLLTYWQLVNGLGSNVWEAYDQLESPETIVRVRRRRLDARGHDIVDAKTYKERVVQAEAVRAWSHV